MFTEITVYDDYTTECSDGEDNVDAHELALSIARRDNREMGEDDIYVLRIDEDGYIMEYFTDEDILWIESNP